MKGAGETQTGTNEQQQRVPRKFADLSRSRAWSFVFFGSQRSRPVRVDEGEINYLETIPATELREEEHVLSTLMAHSR
jgi:hypothetical protein